MSGAALPRRAPRVAALGAAAALLASGMSIATATTAQADDGVLAPGATASSSNMHLLANLPKHGAFAAGNLLNSDLAFKGDYAFAGNYNGFTVYDIQNPRKPREVVQLVCPGSQNDISVHGDLLFLSVDSRRTDDTCSSGVASGAQTASGDYWEGVRIFDISNPAAPDYKAAVETDCGSHTHTLVPGADGQKVYLYVSSYSPSTGQAKCQPPHDKISVVEVPVAAPETASVVNEPVLFPGGGYPGNPNGGRTTSGCHDITAYPAKGIAAGACMGEGVILDISDPVNPVVTETVYDEANFAFWHSATFDNAADSVVFTDELGGGSGATCNPAIGPTRGANALYTLRDGQLDFASYYKISRTQGPTENCVAHNGSLIPVKGKDVMVQAWYQGGISVYDFTDPTSPVEIAWFDRGALEPKLLGGSWSAYYYEGYIYSNDIQKGLDVLEVRDPRVANGKSGGFPQDYNVQSQVPFKGV